MKSTTRNLSWFDRLMVAVTFAEANEREIALTFVRRERGECGEKGLRHGLDSHAELVKK